MKLANTFMKLFVLTFFLSLTSCIDFCNDSFYVYEIPITISPQQSEFTVGDTIFIQMIIDRTMVYDTSNDKHFNIPEFNPHLKIHNVVIDTYPTVDDLDTLNFICKDVNCRYAYIHYSAMSSYGVRIDEPTIRGDSIIINCGIVLKKSGTHGLFFDSPIALIDDDIEFVGKCKDSYANAYMHLLHENNEFIITQKHREVMDKYFSKVPPVQRRSAKYYFNVTE